ncbi:MAG: hypothetical protein J07HQW2_00410 [Haloquadratum walsbyi J07HQW2]|uniref:Uncharacterized protein n=1 Tax=Haloquadratum walsbyi J07HQW2 TaxID=1238425 RepID=U1PNX2_9EURY|nr:MAG: hypothetical protein J07HQW2_00410 [Haloquadratum walsbyi J07HQW2]
MQLGDMNCPDCNNPMETVGEINVYTRYFCYICVYRRDYLTESL